MRKADLEGQSADVIDDVLFRLTIESSLHQRGEGQIESVRQWMKNLQESLGELSTGTASFTAALGYCSPQLMCEVSNFGYISIFIMSEHLLSDHPFVRVSHLEFRPI